MTKEEIEKEKLGQLYKKLVSNARAILTNQIGLPLGVQKMTKILTWIEHIQPADIDGKIFNEYYDKTASIPLGTERLHWNIESLKSEDKKLSQLTDIYKDKILEKCTEIINKFSN